LKNRAKCKLCGDVIESKHRHDFVACKCENISVDGGNDYCHMNVKDKQGFCMIDDEGNEIIPKYSDALNEPITAEEVAEKILPKPKREELLCIMDEMVRRIDELPKEAILSPVTHADFSSLLMLLSSIFRAC
jgi:hypothetical protein